jgi:hypothetical protein
MAIENSDVIDAVGIETATGDIVLTIADSLDWESAETEHLEMLQDKLNAYLRFIQSGELLETYPDAVGRRAVISLVGRCEPSATALRFLDATRQTIEAAGFGFRFEKYAGDSTNVA